MKETIDRKANPFTLVFFDYNYFLINSENFCYE